MFFHSLVFSGRLCKSSLAPLAGSPSLLPPFLSRQRYVCAGPSLGADVAPPRSPLALLAIAWLVGVAFGALLCRFVDGRRFTRARRAAEAAALAEGARKARAAQAARACIPPLDLAGAVARKRANMARTYLERSSGFVIEAQAGQQGLGVGTERGQASEGAASLGKGADSLPLSTLLSVGEGRGLSLEPVYAPLKSADAAIGGPPAIEVAAEYSEEGGRCT